MDGAVDWLKRHHNAVLAQRGRHHQWWLHHLCPRQPDRPIGVPVYSRGYFGEAFNLVTATDWGDLSTDSYRCGVTIQ
ncbi:hypothetical protein [Cystobacter fuscus]|uniref:hypothetical protein n=1 Tax=Cystobacter fuscus TaxID=43 RepID=UPI002B292C00|nr:hypothetical protein F0U63_00845 [Cystobacter fuscus]